MQREYPGQPLVGVGAVIIADARVVLVKRGKAPLLGEWSIPGGMLELGETVRAGAEREALDSLNRTLEQRAAFRKQRKKDFFHINGLRGIVIFADPDFL